MIGWWQGGGEKLQNVKDDLDEMAGNDQVLHDTRIKKTTTPDTFWLKASAKSKDCYNHPFF